MKKLILSVMAAGALVLPVFAEDSKELLFARFSAPAPASGEVTASVSVVEGGLAFKVMDKDPLFIPFEAMPLLEKAWQEEFKK